MTISIEMCPCDTCVYKTVAAKMAYLVAKRDGEMGQAGWYFTEAELEAAAAEYLAGVLKLERERRAL